LPYLCLLAPTTDRSLPATKRKHPASRARQASPSPRQVACRCIPPSLFCQPPSPRLKLHCHRGADYSAALGAGPATPAALAFLQGRAQTPVPRDFPCRGTNAAPLAGTQKQIVAPRTVARRASVRGSRKPPANQGRGNYAHRPQCAYYLSATCHDERRPNTETVITGRILAPTAPSSAMINARLQRLSLLF
jgi:hypothetical protein